MSQHCPVIPKKLRDLPFKGQRERQIGQLDDKVLNVTMEACLIQLIGPVMIDGQMNVLVMGYQRMNKYFWRNAEREQQQQHHGQYALYGR